MTEAVVVEPTGARRASRWGRALRWGAVALGLASVAGNAALFVALRRSYVRQSEVELDPYGTRHATFPLDMPSGPSPSATGIVLMIGDSRARDWPPPPMPGYRYVNRAIGGQTTAQILGRFDAHVGPVEPNVVVLQAGINDLKAIPLFPHRRDEIVADCKANLREIVRRAVDGGASVVLTTIFPPAAPTLDRMPVWSPEIEAAVVEVNAYLRTLASDKVRVLDAWSLLESGGRMRSAYAIDTLHMAPEGYRALNIPLEQQVRALTRTVGSP